MCLSARQVAKLTEELTALDSELGGIEAELRKIADSTPQVTINEIVKSEKTTNFSSFFFGGFI